MDRLSFLISYLFRPPFFFLFAHFFTVTAISLTLSLLPLLPFFVINTSPFPLRLVWEIFRYLPVPLLLLANLSYWLSDWSSPRGTGIDLPALLLTASFISFHLVRYSFVSFETSFRILNPFKKFRSSCRSRRRLLSTAKWMRLFLLIVEDSSQSPFPRTLPVDWLGLKILSRAPRPLTILLRGLFTQKETEESILWYFRACSCRAPSRPPSGPGRRGKNRMQNCLFLKWNSRKFSRQFIFIEACNFSGSACSLQIPPGEPNGWRRMWQLLLLIMRSHFHRKSNELSIRLTSWRIGIFCFHDRFSVIAACHSPISRNFLPLFPEFFPKIDKLPRHPSISLTRETSPKISASKTVPVVINQP